MVEVTLKVEMTLKVALMASWIGKEQCSEEHFRWAEVKVGSMEKGIPKEICWGQNSRWVGLTQKGVWKDFHWDEVKAKAADPHWVGTKWKDAWKEHWKQTADCSGVRKVTDRCLDERKSKVVASA